jgi:alpha-tubulin suppressor-like RCC1 family protein
VISYFNNPIEIITPGERITTGAIFKGQYSSSNSMIVFTDGCSYAPPTPAVTTNVTLTRKFTLVCNGSNDIYGVGNVHGQDIALFPSQNITNIDNETIVDIQTGNGHTSNTGAYGFTIALTIDGRLYGWGYNGHGLVGDGTLINVTYPKLIPLNSQVLYIACAYVSCVVLTSDNTLLGWGYARSALSANNPDKVPTPIPKGTIGNRAILKIAVGANIYIALTTDNIIHAWGTNQYGSLGDTTFLNSATSYRYIPTVIAVGDLNAKNISTIYAGGYMGVAIATDKKLYSWGMLTSSIGIGGGQSSITQVPTLVSTGKLAASMSISNYNSYVLNTDGTVYSYGDNTYYQTGDTVMTTTNRLTYTQMLVFSTYTSLNTESSERVLNITAGDRVAYFRTTTSRLYAFGDNTNGQLGVGFYKGLNYVPTPMEIVIPTKKVLMVASSGQFAVIVTNGCSYSTPTITVTNYTFNCPNKPPKLYGIGFNNLGQLGIPTSILNTAATIPTATYMDDALSSAFIVSVTSGLGFTVALSADGTLYAWGNNSAGTLGNGPTPVTPGSAVEVYSERPSALYLQFVISVACGSKWCIALTSTNDLVQWGTIFRGDPPYQYTSTYTGVNATLLIPTLVNKGAIGSRTIACIAMGSFHALVLTTDNRIYAWGSNANGQLGDGTTSKYMRI